MENFHENTKKGIISLYWFSSFIYSLERCYYYSNHISVCKSWQSDKLIHWKCVLKFKLVTICLKLKLDLSPPGGGGCSLIRTIYCRYVWPQRVWFFSRLGHKLDIHFSHFAAILVINRVSISIWFFFLKKLLLHHALLLPAALSLPLTCLTPAMHVR